MPSLDESFHDVLNALAERYGPPASPVRRDEPFRAMLEIVLSRTADSRKVAKVLEQLSADGLIETYALANAEPEELRDALRDCGIGSPAKLAAVLQRLAHWLVERHRESADSLDALATTPTEQLREELVALNGVGAATADAALLFALRRPVYPLDRASYRILARHGWVDPWAEYDEARGLVEHACGDDPERLQHLSRWLERLGREYCKASVAQCEHCPLRAFLPAGGPVGLDGE